MIVVYNFVESLGDFSMYYYYTFGMAVKSNILFSRFCMCTKQDYINCTEKLKIFEVSENYGSGGYIIDLRKNTILVNKTEICSNVFEQFIAEVCIADYLIKKGEILLNACAFNIAGNGTVISTDSEKVREALCEAALQKNCDIFAKNTIRLKRLNEKAYICSAALQNYNEKNIFSSFFVIENTSFGMAFAERVIGLNKLTVLWQHIISNISGNVKYVCDKNTADVRDTADMGKNYNVQKTGGMQKTADMGKYYSMQNTAGIEKDYKAKLRKCIGVMPDLKVHKLSISINNSSPENIENAAEKIIEIVVNINSDMKVKENIKE